MVVVVRTLFTIYKHYVDFVNYIFTIFLEIQHENNFLPTSKHRQAKDSPFLGICLYDCFIYRLSLSLLAPVEKQRIAKHIPPVMGANQNERKVLFTDLVNTNIKHRR